MEPITADPKVLVADSLDERGVQILLAGGLDAVCEYGLTEDRLCAVIGAYEGLIVRSATQVTGSVIKAGRRLRVIGRAGVGVDNIDLDAATAAGILVQNTPLGNITSAAEHALGLLFACARNIPRADREMKAGRWSKKGCTGVELSGKTLGIVGLGKVGNIVARVARSVGMNIVIHDPYMTDQRAAELGVARTDLDDMLQRADFVSIHAPCTSETRNLIGLERLRLMKKTARLINAARGGIVDEQALTTVLQEGAIAGAALDVFAVEPLAPDSPLRQLENVILTPHLGASTEEAQARVAEDVARQFVAFFRDGTIRNAVNLTVQQNPRMAPYARLAETLGRIAAQMTAEPVNALRVGCYGKLAQEDTRELSVSALRGFLRHASEEPVTLVNAPLIAQALGIDLIENKSEKSPTYANLLLVEAETAAGRRVLGGTCFDDEEARIVRIDEFLIDVKPADCLLIMVYPDRPGMVGKFGTILGAADINIANMAVGRREKRGRAMVVLTLDDPVRPDVVARIRAAVDVESLHAVSL